MSLSAINNNRDVKVKDRDGNQAINVNIGGQPVAVEFGQSGETKLFYNEVSSVALNTDTLVGSYTVPVDKIFKLQRCEVSGDNVAVFSVFIASILSSKKRIWWQHWNEEFEFNELLLNAGDTVEIFVNNNSATSMTGNFSGNIIGVEDDV